VRLLSNPFRSRSVLTDTRQRTGVTVRTGNQLDKPVRLPGPETGLPRLELSPADGPLAIGSAAHAAAGAPKPRALEDTYWSLVRPQLVQIGVEESALAEMDKQIRWYTNKPLDARLDCVEQLGYQLQAIGRSFERKLDHEGTCCGFSSKLSKDLARKVAVTRNIADAWEQVPGGERAVPLDTRWHVSYSSLGETSIISLPTPPDPSQPQLLVHHDIDPATGHIQTQSFSQVTQDELPQVFHFDRADGSTFEQLVVLNAKALTDSYADLGVPRTQRTAIWKVRDDAVMPPGPQAPRFGSFNQVYELRVCNLDDPNDRATRQVMFKPLQKPDGSSIYTGVTQDAAQDRSSSANRNLAACELDDLLGFEVIVPTDMGWITLPGSDRQTLGLVMDKADGSQGYKTDLRNGNVVRKLTMLQIEDAIAGQTDRHGGNYFVRVWPGGDAVVTAIDNDQCFEKDLLDPNGIAQSHPADWRRGVLLPRVVDRVMYDAVMAVTADSVRSRLRPYLTHDEVEAAVIRLERVKEHMMDEDRCSIIEDLAEWGNQSLWNILSAKNSYFKRDCPPVQWGTQ
jgi:hypothetical protein